MISNMVKLSSLVIKANSSGALPVIELLLCSVLKQPLVTGQEPATWHRSQIAGLIGSRFACCFSPVKPEQDGIIAGSPEPLAPRSSRRRCWQRARERPYSLWSQFYQRLCYRPSSCEAKIYERWGRQVSQELQCLFKP